MAAISLTVQPKRIGAACVLGAPDDILALCGHTDLIRREPPMAGGLFFEPLHYASIGVSRNTVSSLSSKWSASALLNTIGGRIFSTL